MTDDERAIRELVDTWMTASAAGDTQTVLELMSDDAVFLTPGQKPFGKEAFSAASQSLKDLRIEGKSDIEELQIHGDFAWLRNHLAITVTPLAGGEPIRRSGYTLTILRKSADGRWQLVRDANLLTKE
jgi:uncharacterized protein (TIGR02246 family)